MQLKQIFQIGLIVIPLLFLLFLAELTSRAATPADEPSVRVAQFGNTLVVETPYGKRELKGGVELGESRDFLISLPLDSFQKLESTSAAAPVHNFQSDANILLEKANLAYTQSALAEASALVDEALALSPNNVRALMMQGSLAYLRGEKESAKDSWQKASRLDPANPEIPRVLEKFK